VLTSLPPRRVLLGMILAAFVAVVVAIALWVRADGGVPFQARGYQVSVRLPDGTGLVRGADVQLSGVVVGRVVRVTAAGTDTDTLVEIDPEFAPLPRDTRAMLRNKSVLGERYVALSPGTVDGPTIPEGGRLSSSRVEVAPTVGEVLDMFDEPTRRSIRRLTGTLERTLRDRGQDLNELLAGAPEVTRELERLSAVVDRSRPTVARVLRRTDRVLAAVNGSDADLRGLLRDAATIVSDTAARDDALRATIDGLPGLTEETEATLAVARRVLRSGAPVARRLREGSTVLPATVRSVDRLVPALASLLEAARPELVRIGRMLPDVERITDRFPGLLPDLREVTRRMPSFFRILEAYDDQLVSWTGKLGAMTQASTVGVGGRKQHYIRLAMTIPASPLYGVGERPSYFRSNEYPAPGALNALRSGTLEAFDCRHTSNATLLPPFGGTPPCITQKPWTFDGVTAQWPHVRPLP